MVFGRVYTIRSHQTTNVYVGSTTQILCKRLSDHRVNYKSFINGEYHYVTSYEIIQYADNYIELLYENEFESVDMLRKKEGDFIREMMNCVNKFIPGRTDKEYYEDHKARILERQKKYNEKHTEQISERQKKYYEKHTEQILEKAKIYYNKNKEIKLEKAKQYQEDHKTQISEKHKIKYTCQCGSICSKGAKSIHERSQKHQAFILSLSTE
jgi:hypothetical protein